MINLLRFSKRSFTFNFSDLFKQYKEEGFFFLAVFLIVFSSLKLYSTAASDGNVEQWVNLTNQMFYGRQDFLFSYGPLYWLTGGASSQYSVSTYWLSITFLSILNACFWSSIFTLIYRARSYFYFSAAYFIFFSSLNFSPALFLLPFAVVSYFEFSKDHPLAASSWLIFALGVLVGFFFYLRFFYGIIGLATFGTYFFVQLLSERKTFRFLLFFLGLIVSYVFLGLIIFHEISNSLNYLVINKNLSFGNSVDLTLDVFTSKKTFVAVTFIILSLNAYLVLKRRSLLLTTNVLFLILFKLGFSRADHLIAYFIIPVAALSLILIFEKDRFGRMLFVLTISCLYYISVNQIYPLSPSKDSLLPATDFRVQYEDRMQNLYAEFKLEEGLVGKIGKSTVDVYPYNNEYVFANKLNYKHRPSFQNFMTLTPALDTMNRKFFESSDRPRFILFTSGIACRTENCNVFDGFDQKLSLNEDPLTVSSILLNYHTVKVSKGKNGIPLILLEENDEFTVYTETMISSEIMKFGEWYKVPRSENGVTKIIPNFEFSNFGHIKNLLFRGSILTVRYKLISGNIREYRLNILNSNSGVWASPLLNSFELSGDAVDSLMFVSQSPNYLNPKFNSRWVKVQIPGVHNN